MNKIDYETIEQYINEDNIIGKGKEVTCYDYGNSVIKIFSSNRTSPYKLISIDGIIKLNSLPLYFNKPDSLIVKDDEVIGYTEDKLVKSELDKNNIDYEGIKEDIICLSDNGFRIKDLYYNYIIHDSEFHFIDLTSYIYIPTEEFLKKSLKTQHKRNEYILNWLFSFWSFPIK